MLRNWDINFDLQVAAGVPLYMGLADEIVKEIQSGRLTANTVMPGTRALAKKLSVNRKTVVLCYEELISQGWLTTQHRRGTFVSPLTQELEANNAHAYRHELVAANDSVLDFTDESVAMHDFVDTVSKAFYKVFRCLPQSKTQIPAHPSGIYALRKQLAEMLSLEYGFQVSYQNLCVVSKPAVARYLIFRYLARQQKKIVLFEKLCEPNLIEVASSLGLYPISIDIDQDGMKVEQIKSLCAQGDVAAVFVSPQHQYPTGAYLSDFRRKVLKELSEKHGFILVESDQHHLFNFSSQPVTTLLRGNETERHLYISDLSRYLPSGLNLGFLVAPDIQIQAFEYEIKLSGFQMDTPFQLAVANLLESGEIQRIRRKLSTLYAGRQSCMLTHLKSQLADYVNFDVPYGGLGVWLVCKPMVDIERLKSNLAASKLKVQTSEHFDYDASEAYGIRLSFCHLSEEQIAAGIRKLKQVLQSSLFEDIH